MNDKPYEKLPKWAREKIATLTRERETALRALNEYIDAQTPSEIYIDEWESTGEQRGPSTKRRYIQGYNIEFQHAGVHLRIAIHQDDCIELQWGDSIQDIALIPKSYQRATLVSKENMR